MAYSGRLHNQGEDHYGVRSFTEDLPEQHRYKWKPQSAPVNDEYLKLYNLHATRDQSIVPLHHLLGIPEELTELEETRVNLVETLIGFMRESSQIVDIIYEIESGQPSDLRQSFCASIVALTGQSMFPTKVYNFLLYFLDTNLEYCVTAP